MVRGAPDLRTCALKYGPKLEKPLRREKKQEFANKKPKFDNARRLRGICFINPEDGEYNEISKNARRKVGSSNGGGYALKKIKKHSGLQETEAKSGESNTIPKTKYACIVEAHESTRQRPGIFSAERS